MQLPEPEIKTKRNTMNFLRSLNVKRKLALLIGAFALSFLLFALAAFATLNQLKVSGPYYGRIVTSKDIVADVLPPPKYIIESYLVVLQMADATDAARLSELKQRGEKLHSEYLTQQGVWEKDPILNNDTRLEAVKQGLLVDSNAPAQRFYALRDGEFQKAINKGDRVRARALAHGELLGLYEEHRKAIDDVVKNSVAYKDTVEAEAEQEVKRRTAWMIGLSIAVLALIGLVLGLGLSRSITHRLGETLSALSATSTEMGATVEQQERTAVLQSAAVHETTTTMDELDASFNQTAEMVRIAADTAQQAASSAADGLETVRQTLEGMTHLKEKVGAVSEQISNLSEQTAQISGITRVVGDLANQTNMLALNAAVEAARAGEHGKGFGVVATEIRNLADESKKSADRINSLVEDIRRATDATVMATEEGNKTVDSDMRLAQQTALAFNGIVESCNAALEAAQQTLLAVPQQIAAVRQVLSAMEDLNRGAKETADGLGQTRASVDNLREAAQQLKAMV
jgi:hypothetical protein